VAFAEIEDFLDTPVKRYSSGMYVRLAFAVAAHLEPEILIVDEVLAVGDAAFQQKCLGKMQTIAGHGRTVLFVSHNIAAIIALTTNALLFDHGRLIDTGSPEALGNRYRLTTRPLRQHSPPYRNGLYSITEFIQCDAAGALRSTFEFSEPITVRLSVHSHDHSRSPHVLIALYRAHDDLRVTSITTRELPIGPLVPGLTEISFVIPPFRLYPGSYYWIVRVQTSHQVLLDATGLHSLTIRDSIIPGCDRPFVSGHGVAFLPRAVNWSTPNGPGAVALDQLKSA
jgi:lipopolysaccharide transport system ATP-binding protein